MTLDRCELFLNPVHQWPQVESLARYFTAGYS